MDLTNLYNDFRQYGYTWKIGGVDRRPSLDDFTKVVESLIKTLEDEPASSQVETGHLLVKKVGLDSPLYDVYVHATTLTADL